LESDEWLEYKLPEEFKVGGRVLGSWINKAKDTVIVVVEESLWEYPIDSYTGETRNNKHNRPRKCPEWFKHNIKVVLRKTIFITS